MKQRGFTLIELMVVITIGMVVVSIGLGFLGATSGNSNISVGINGVTESRCIEGYKFVLSASHEAPRQIIDEFGKGVRCNAMVK